jgi:hypothetical protein
MKTQQLTQVASVKDGRNPSTLESRTIAMAEQSLLIAASLPEDKIGQHLSEIILQSATGAYFAHTDANAFSSLAMLIEKRRIVLLELRRLQNALRLLCKMAIPCNGQAVKCAVEEVEILIRMFISMLRVLESNQKNGGEM